MSSQRILLVDDHALLREGLAGLFAHQPDFQVVGEADNAQAALAQAQQLKPDLVLMDIDMPGEDGVSATAKIKASVPQATVVMLTVHEDADTLLEAIKSGAQGYMVKNMRMDELLAHLRRLASGEVTIPRRIARRILEEERREEGVMPLEDEELTAREIQVLQLVAGSRSNRDIAERLVISEHTVKNHIRSILAKLQVRNRRQAAVYGIARGWVQPDTKGA
jgi:DNA-binding NarL/FixJ family response regulator